MTPGSRFLGEFFARNAVKKVIHPISTHLLKIHRQTSNRAGINDVGVKGFDQNGGMILGSKTPTD